MRVELAHAFNEALSNPPAPSTTHTDTHIFKVTCLFLLLQLLLDTRVQPSERG